ncbi:hypothetical protein AB0K09_20320 [Streptomyces sp. NPDC049577]|uniref:hypothetical protein n=1 Tax=Streptomyces sp. NPDC049577 TaxID=3155153 RepID=UPI00341852A1
MTDSAALDLVEEFVTGPHSAASGLFADESVYRYRETLTAYAAWAGDLLWQPTQPDVQNFVIHHARAAASRDQAVGIVRSFYRYLEGRDLVPAGTYRELLKGWQRFASVDRTPRPGGLDAAGMLRLKEAADRHAGPRDRAIIYGLMNAPTQLRPGQITGLLLEDRYNEQHRTRWAVPMKNASRTAKALITFCPDFVWAIDEYLPHRVTKEKWNTYDGRGPLFTSRTGRALGGDADARREQRSSSDNAILRIVRNVAALHPALREVAPTLSADAIAHSPSPLVHEGDDQDETAAPPA